MTEPIMYNWTTKHYSVETTTGLCYQPDHCTHVKCTHKMNKQLQIPSMHFR